MIVILKKTGEEWFKSHILEMHTHDVKSMSVDASNRLFSGGKAQLFLNNYIFM